MEKKFWGNMPAYKHLCNYAAQKYPGPLILIGKQGLGKKIAAFFFGSLFARLFRRKLISK